MELKSRCFTSREPHVTRESQVADPWLSSTRQASSTVYSNKLSLITNPKLSFCTFLTAYSRSKLNIIGDEASPCFKQFSMGMLENKQFPVLTLYRVPSKQILINLTFFGTPNLIRVSYKDSLFLQGHRASQNL